MFLCWVALSLPVVAIVIVLAMALRQVMEVA